MKKILFVAAFAAALSGCATPTVVDRKHVGDPHLSCEQIRSEIVNVQALREEAREDRGVTPLNVAAAVFFWPALVGTYVNTDEAIRASEERERYLEGLLHQQNCE